MPKRLMIESPVIDYTGGSSRIAKKSLDLDALTREYKPGILEVFSSRFSQDVQVVLKERVPELVDSVVEESFETLAQVEQRFGPKTRAAVEDQIRGEAARSIVNTLSGNSRFKVSWFRHSLGNQINEKLISLKYSGKDYEAQVLRVKAQNEDKFEIDRSKLELQTRLVETRLANFDAEAKRVSSDSQVIVKGINKITDTVLNTTAKGVGEVLSVPVYAIDFAGEGVSALTVVLLEKLEKRASIDRQAGFNK